jgi:RNA-directed DNA polymerase
MRRESHVRFCEGVGVKFPRATRHVACFQYREDATRFQAAMIERLAKFGLEIEPTKTTMLEVGRFAEQNAKQRGERPKTFDFLGFTHFCGRTKDGKRVRVGRTTSGKKYRAKLAATKEWIKRNRTKPLRWIMERVAAMLRGHFAYYAVSGNSKAIGRFAFEVKKQLFKWLGRRGKRKALDWATFDLLLKRFPLPRPRITVMMYEEVKVDLRSRVR